MIIACDSNKKYVRADEANKSNDYFCPGCHEKVILKSGEVKQKHFSHCSGTACVTFTENESVQHLAGKLQIASKLQYYGNVQIEAVLPEIQQRPDILLIHKNKRIAIEYQCSPISQKRINMRNKGYLTENIQVIWVLGQTYFNRVMTQATIMKFMADNALVFYLPDQQHFVHRQHFSKPDFSRVQFVDKIGATLFSTKVPKQRTKLNVAKQAYKLQGIILQKRVDPKVVDYLYKNNRLLMNVPVWVHGGNTFGLKVPNWYWRLITILFLEKIGQQNVVKKAELTVKLIPFLLGDDTFKQQQVAELYHDLEVHDYILQQDNYILVRRLPHWKNARQQSIVKI
ncbi:competence protein [Leuconostoc koreense]|nr:competence protein [Leuconostoc mesenteroides]QGM25294.1 competence protein [Leuconostoc mesenteroides subsp. mesenteroides]